MYMDTYAEFQESAFTIYYFIVYYYNASYTKIFLVFEMVLIQKRECKILTCTPL